MRIAFVCVENSNRSQMAEAYSAGSQPSGEVHPTAIEAMKELGYNLSVHRSKGLDELPKKRYDMAVMMGCGMTVRTLSPTAGKTGISPIQRPCTSASFAKCAT